MTEEEWFQYHLDRAPSVMELDTTRVIGVDFKADAAVLFNAMRNLSA